MLTKSVCSNCGHSYLSDDELGDAACPRCEAVSDDFDVTPDLNNDQFGDEPAYNDPYEPNEPYDPAPRFAPQALPAMYITFERLLRGIAMGGIVSLLLGAVLGAALTAIDVELPLVAVLLVALVGGAALRSGFGGRAAPQTKGRVAIAAIVVVLFGAIGMTAGSWMLDRFAGQRAEQARADLDEGIKGLKAQRDNVKDAGISLVIAQRISEAERLRSLSDAHIEDYLWAQEAQVSQPLLAYGKLRATTAPVIRLGPKGKPIGLPQEGTIAVRVAEAICGVVLVLRAVKATRGQ